MPRKTKADNYSRKIVKVGPLGRPKPMPKKVKKCPPPLSNSMKKD